MKAILTPNGGVRFIGIADAAIEAMSDAELYNERKRAKAEIKRFEEIGMGMRRCHGNAKVRRQEYNCLKCEERRIDAAIKRRAEHVAASEPTLAVSVAA